MSMLMISTLEEYVNSKKGAAADHHNAVKEKVFAEILKLLKGNKLTVNNLTDILTQLNEVDRYKLYYLGRKLGRGYEQKASINSQAARWVRDLYFALNVEIDDTDLALIVSKGISDGYARQLKATPYQYWQKYPVSSNEGKYLEHELKEVLELVDDKESKPLAKLLLPQTKEELKQSFLKIQAIIPDFLPEIVNQLYLLHRKEGASEEFMDSLISMTDVDEQLQGELIAKANVEIAVAFVRQRPQIFFTLSASMQDAIQKFLEKHEDFDALSSLKNQLTVINLVPEIEQQQIFKLLSDGAYWQAASINNLHEAHGAFNRLSELVYQRAIPNPIIAYEQDQILPAKRAIDTYLNEAPGAYKAIFFQNLLNAIEQEGLSIALLSQSLEEADRTRLFAKWGGSENSRAAALMAKLYNLASLGKQLDKEQIKEMVTAGDLPLAEQFTNKTKVYCREKVREIFLHPEKINDSILGSLIGKALAYFQSFSQFAHNPQSFVQKQAEAIYQNYLLDKGLELAKTPPIIFDPQGHVLVTVELSEDDYRVLVEIITKDEIRDGTKEQLERLLGSKITKTTLCNLDIVHLSEFRELFVDRVLEKGNSDSLRRALELFLNSPERGSVIALQEEMSLHVGLSLRAIEKFAGRELISTQECHLLMDEINAEVLQEFRQALEQAYTEVIEEDIVHKELDFAVLNQKMDLARKELAPKCRQLLVSALSNTMGANELEAFKEQIAEQPLENSYFTSTTATGLDYLRADAKNATVVRISATEKTAHNKGLGEDEQALRVLARNRYENNRVLPYAESSIEARVPSIACTKVPHQEAVRDVADKLAYSALLLRGKAGNYKGPIIYNLLTSLHSKAYDQTLFERGNQQRLSAARILKGAHIYNRQQVEQGKFESLVYVQNIPVNQHTSELNIDTLDDATREATLMTELALLATFKYHAAVFPPALRDNITAIYDSIHASYLSFLRAKGDGLHYFRNSREGCAVILKLIPAKERWYKGKALIPATDNLQALVVQALFKMVIRNEYHHKEFGMLTQVLSVFVEPLSQAGCKSANERYQGVAGRVELLKSISEVTEERILSKEQQQIRTALINYVQGKGSVNKVQAAIDIAYNKHNLQGSAAVFSEEDQGAPSKVLATQNSNKAVVSEFTTNYAETGFLRNLHQNHASGMQSHKAQLAEEYKGLFKEQEEISSLRDETVDNKNSYRL